LCVCVCKKTEKGELFLYGPELGVADEEELGVVLHEGVGAVHHAHEDVLLQNGVQAPAGWRVGRVWGGG
jgi:hypothetical protein